MKPEQCFNSKLVRLKDADWLLRGKYRSGFNSKLVRLKDADVLLRGKYHAGFNSKLVRLKVKCFAVKLTRSKVFQFQIGSIKSCFSNHLCACIQRGFQFQIGSIKSPRHLTGVVH